MFVRLVSDIYDVCVGRWAENSIPPHTRLPFSWFSNRQKSPIKIARYKRIKIAAYKEY